MQTQTLYRTATGIGTHLITLVNTQNASVTKIVDSSLIQCAESKYGLRKVLAVVVMIHKVWLKA
jgi:hypothetical protein